MSYEVGTSFQFSNTDAETKQRTLYMPGTRIVFVNAIESMAQTLIVRPVLT